MRKKIVFILGHYSPDYSANGLCVKKIVDILVENHDVVVICRKTDNNQLNIEKFESHTIIRTSDIDTRVRNRTKKVINNSESTLLEIMFNIILLKFIQIKGYLQTIFKKTSINVKYVESFITALCSLDEPIDLIVPVCFPFESVVAAIKYKEQSKSNIVIIPYLLDKFSSSEEKHRTKWNKILKWKKHLLMEQEMIDKSKHVVASIDWKKHIEQYIKPQNKVSYVEMQALCPLPKENIVKYDNSKINIVYTGALNNKIRPAKYFLQLFDKILDNNNKIVLQLYTKGNCNNLIKKFELLKPNQILNHGSVKVDVAYSAMTNSDILLSVGNIDVTQQPSKIYEYMSCGKPIIHLYHSEKDPINTVLSKYPISICIKQHMDSFEYNIDVLEGFIEKHLNSSVIPYTLVESIFKESSPQYTVEILNENINF